MPARMSPATDRPLSPREFGDRVGYTERTIRKFIKLGTVRAVRINNRFKIPVTELAKFTVTTEADSWSSSAS